MFLCAILCLKIPLHWVSVMRSRVNTMISPLKHRSHITMLRLSDLVLVWCGTLHFVGSQKQEQRPPLAAQVEIERSCM